ncbi:MAG: N-acetylneuraminate synthase [Actinomycetota bacterium]
MSGLFIIAEAGVNHNGQIDMALKLIDVAADAHADAVKFQTFRADLLVSRKTPLAEYQRHANAPETSQYEMLKSLELSPAQHVILRDYANKRGIQFLSTPFDSSSLRLITTDLGITTIKVPSGEITNVPYLVEVARVASHVILSTGASSLAEVRIAINALAYGFANARGIPTEEEIDRADDVHSEDVRSRVTLLHAVTSYPAPTSEMNLRAMHTLREHFGCRVGLSDHTLGSHISIAAVALGAQVIEKHFTLDRTLRGPDHASSLEPHELTDLVVAARQVVDAVGDGTKQAQPSELSNREIVRRAIVAIRPINAGEILSEENIGLRRPSSGLAPQAWWSTVGTTAQQNYSPGDPIHPSH